MTVSFSRLFCFGAAMTSLTLGLGHAPALKAAQKEADGWAAGTVFRLQPFEVRKSRILNISEVDKEPKRLSVGWVIYPDTWRHLGITALVTVKFIVDERGRVRDLRATQVTLGSYVDASVFRREAARRVRIGEQHLTIPELRDLVMHEFGQAAEDAWRAARFEPALKDGKAVPVYMEADTRFRLL